MFLAINHFMPIISLASWPAARPPLSPIPIIHSHREDPAVHLIPFGEFPGQLQFSIACGPQSAASWAASARDLLAVPTFKRRSYYFWMHVFEATDLVPPADSESDTASPYVFVSVGNRDAAGRERRATCQPIWNQSIGFRVDDFPEPMYGTRARERGRFLSLFCVLFWCWSSCVAWFRQSLGIFPGGLTRANGEFCFHRDCEIHVLSFVTCACFSLSFAYHTLPTHMHSLFHHNQPKNVCV